MVTKRRKVVIDTQDKFKSFVHRLYTAQLDGKLTGDCRMEKTPCLQYKKPLRLDELCLPCRIFRLSEQLNDAVAELDND